MTEPTTTAGAPADGQSQPPAVATPPANADTTGNANPGTGDSQQPPAATPPVDDKPADAPKTFTQADLDRMINERLERDRTAREQADAERNKKLAAALGLASDEEDVDPVKALEDERGKTTAAQARADLAEAKVLAAAAGINPKRVNAFAKLCDLSGALKGVDRTDEKAVEKAIQSAVEQTVEEYPEFKAAALPASSGGDRASSGPQAVTLEQFKKMDVSERQELYKSNEGLYKQLAAQAKA